MSTLLPPIPSNHPNRIQCCDLSVPRLQDFVHPEVSDSGHTAYGKLRPQNLRSVWNSGRVKRRPFTWIPHRLQGEEEEGVGERGKPVFGKILKIKRVSFCHTQSTSSRSDRDLSGPPDHSTGSLDPKGTTVPGTGRPTLDPSQKCSDVRVTPDPSVLLGHFSGSMVSLPIPFSLHGSLVAPSFIHKSVLDTT